MLGLTDIAFDGLVRECHPLSAQEGNIAELDSPVCLAFLCSECSFGIMISAMEESLWSFLSGVSFRGGLHCVVVRVLCHAQSSEGDEGDGKKKRVLVMGGTGRVGASTLRALAKGGDLHLVVGGRNRYRISPCCTPAPVLCLWRHSSSFFPARYESQSLTFREKGEALARELGGSVEFLGFDMDDASALRAAVDGLKFCAWFNYNSAFVICVFTTTISRGESLHVLDVQV